jgi:hypothetical protein
MEIGFGPGFAFNRTISNDDSPYTLSVNFQVMIADIWARGSWHLLALLGSRRILEFPARHGRLQCERRQPDDLRDHRRQADVDAAAWFLDQSRPDEEPEHLRTGRGAVRRRQFLNWLVLGSRVADGPDVRGLRVRGLCNR